MPPYFNKILNPDNTPAKKLHNSSYLEDLTDLLRSVASKINGANYYFFEDGYFVESHPDEPNCSYNDFIKEFKSTFLNSHGNKIHIIRGRSGIGKTLFFKKGFKKLIYDNVECRGKYIKLGVDFRNIDQKQHISYYEKLIYTQLSNNAIEAIDALRNYDKSPELNEQYHNFHNLALTRVTYNDYLFPVMYFCNKIYSNYKKRPCMIIFDNIDLSCAETQRSVFQATVNVCEKLSNLMESNNCGDRHRVFFAMRPETFHRGGDLNDGEYINFPLPNILKITLETIKKVLFETAKQFDDNKNLKCNVTFHSIIDEKRIEVTSYSDVANYFVQVLEHYLLNMWQGVVIERLGESEKFHCNLVNFNIRKFLSFLSNTISNGGFKPLTRAFNERPSHYTVYDYIEMIIRGRWVVYPGNKFIDGEGCNGAPIVFNLFDTSLYNTQEDKIKHFMLNIRILQYFWFHKTNEQTYYRDLNNCLSNFYNPDHIKTATQKLVYVGIIYSFFEGDIVASKKSYSDVTIKDDVGLHLGPEGEFYIDNIIYEFEYLYQMALSSIMPEDYTKQLKKAEIYLSEKEQTVLYFLKGIFEILKINIDEYKNHGKLENFKEIFCQDNPICKPYRNMLKKYVTVINNKIQAATTKGTSKLEKLKKILNDAQELQKVADEFLQKLDN
jgi:hypothetical protein